MKTNSFTFYRDYYNLIDTISDKDKKVLLCAIVDYMFKDIDPKLSGHNEAIFNTLKNQLNVSKCNSKRRTKQEPNKNQIETEQELKENKTSVLSFKFNNINTTELDRDKSMREEEENKIYSYVESNLGITLNGFNYEKIQKLLNIYSADVLCYAIDKTIASGKKTLNYFIGIVNNWESENLKNLEEIKKVETKGSGKDKSTSTQYVEA